MRKIFLIINFFVIFLILLVRVNGQSIFVHAQQTEGGAGPPPEGGQPCGGQCEAGPPGGGGGGPPPPGPEGHPPPEGGEGVPPPIEGVPPGEAGEGAGGGGESSPDPLHNPAEPPPPHSSLDDCNFQCSGWEWNSSSGQWEPLFGGDAGGGGGGGPGGGGGASVGASAPSCSSILVTSPAWSGTFNAGWTYHLNTNGAGGQAPISPSWSASCQGYTPNTTPQTGSLVTNPDNSADWRVPAPPVPLAPASGGSRIVSCTVNYAGTDAVGRAFSCPPFGGGWVDGGPPPANPTNRTIFGTIFRDKNGNALQDPTIDFCYTRETTITADSDDDLQTGLPHRHYSTKIDQTSCDYTITGVEDHRRYKVVVTPSGHGDFITGWNDGHPPGFKGTMTAIIDLSVQPTQTPAPTSPPVPTPTVFRTIPTPTVIPTPTSQPSFIDTLYDVTLGRFFPSPTSLPQPTATPIPVVPTATPLPVGGGRQF